MHFTMKQLRTAAVISVAFAVTTTHAVPQCFQLVGDPRFDLSTPMAGDAGFGPICRQYNSSRCCSDNFTATFGGGPGGSPNPSAIYPAYQYNQCPQNRTLSAACLSFLVLQECNFACDPTLAGAYAAVVPVPLCSSFCDAWFAACAHDFTCVTNWQAWPLTTVNNVTGYFCPADASQCRTYADRYGSGEGLCNGMWGPTYTYSTNFSSCSNLTWRATSGTLSGKQSVNHFVLSISVVLMMLALMMMH